MNKSQVFLTELADLMGKHNAEFNIEYYDGRIIFSFNTYESNDIMIRDDRSDYIDMNYQDIKNAIERNQEK